ncbi:hypothetical protein LINPERPRIM_LOCUS34312, partial [Linum perenne]
SILSSSLSISRKTRSSASFDPICLPFDSPSFPFSVLSPPLSLGLFFLPSWLFGSAVDAPICFVRVPYQRNLLAD